MILVVLVLVDAGGVADVLVVAVEVLVLIAALQAVLFVRMDAALDVKGVAMGVATDAVDAEELARMIAMDALAAAGPVQIIALLVLGLVKELAIMDAPEGNIAEFI